VHEASLMDAVVNFDDSSTGLPLLSMNGCSDCLRMHATMRKYFGGKKLWHSQDTVVWAKKKLKSTVLIASSL
jgi:hypothetical protein